MNVASLLATSFEMFGFGPCRDTNCNPFGSADPGTDTVKVTVVPQLAEEFGGKENVAPEISTIAEAEAAPDDQQQRDASRREREEAESAAELDRLREEQRDFERREAEELKALQDLERLEAEQLQQDEERQFMEDQLAAIAAMERKEAEEAHMHRIAEEERNLQAGQAAEELRLLDEAAAHEREVRRIADKEKVDTFLKTNGYTDVNTKKTKMFASSYPLHSAVKANDADMVQLLLQAHADPGLKDSSKLTPWQFGQKCSKNNSHDAVLALLQAQ